MTCRPLRPPTLAAAPPSPSPSSPVIEEASLALFISTPRASSCCPRPAIEDGRAAPGRRCCWDMKLGFRMRRECGIVSEVGGCMVWKGYWCQECGLGYSYDGTDWAGRERRACERDFLFDTHPLSLQSDVLKRLTIQASRIAITQRRVLRLSRDCTGRTCRAVCHMHQTCRITSEATQKSLRPLTTSLHFR